MLKNMHLPRFNRVCFCCALRIGNILLVYINLILSIVACLFYFYFDVMKFFVRIFTVNVSDMVHRMARSKIVPNFIFYFIFAYGLSEIVMSVVVLIGLHKKRIKPIAVYMYYAIFVTITVLASRLLDRGNNLWYIELAVDLVYIGFKSYYILSIRSQYEIMRKHETDVRTPEIEMSANFEEEHSISDLHVQDLQEMENVLNDKSLV